MLTDEIRCVIRYGSEGTKTVVEKLTFKYFIYLLLILFFIPGELA